MSDLLQWFKGLFRRRERLVVPEGKGYRVQGEWCDSQVAVRHRLEELGYGEGEIIRTLRELNAEKYGRPNR